MKRLLFLLLLVPSIGICDPGDGRYASSSGPMGIVLIDSKTGKSWFLEKTETGPTFRSILFKCGYKQWSEFPDCPSDKIIDARDDISK